MEKVLITGGSGLVGKHLSKKLKEKNFSVSILSTTHKPGETHYTYLWNIDKNEIDEKAIDGIDYIVHLAGANIGDKRWTKKRKQLIVESRVKSTQLIFNTISGRNKKMKAFISASAVGHYGAITSDKIFTEEDDSANDFLGETCKLWEQAADQFNKLGVRVVIIRTGVVLTKQDGALAKMITPIKLGIGSELGNGNQYIPWIHIDDLCNIYIKAIEDIKMNGAYNAVAPEHKTNKEFNKSLAIILNRPFWFPNIPAFIIKLILGKMSDIVLKGSRASSEKIINTGFVFKFPDLKSALMNLIK
jgi:uncharacterized protein (TIGR01777 family)